MTSRNDKQKDLACAWKIINDAQKIILLTHRNPDPDGISACAALATFFEQMGKKVEAIYPTPPESSIQRQPKNVSINKHHYIPDVIIAVDTADYERLYYPEAFKNIPLINIDHHISNTIIGTVNLNNPQAASTCEELYEIMFAWDKSLINHYVAECLLYGILYDSQVFHTQSTSANTLRIAANLMDYGVNLFNLTIELLSNKNPQIVALWGKILSNVTITPSGKAAWVCITQADLKAHNLGAPSIIGFNNFLAQISGVDVTIVFYETETGQTKISLRSKVYDVNKLAQHFGGGGHKNAAGILSNKPLTHIIDEIIALL